MRRDGGGSENERVGEKDRERATTEGEGGIREIQIEKEVKKKKE